MRVGVFGGSFNPPHLGHLILAQSALDVLRLDRVQFVPAHQSPFKPEYAGIRGEERLEMLSLAVSDHPGFDVATIELERHGVSYTVDTLRALTAASPDDSIHLLMGADAFMEFPQWKDPDAIAALCRIGVAQRPGHRLDYSTHPYASIADPFDMPGIDISSSSVREAVRSGRSIQYLVPWAVKVYIEAKGLYK
jgi:nicotinate-nucleotide adenylyltransferase